MRQEEELRQLRAEMIAWLDIASEKHREMQQLQQEEQAVCESLQKYTDMLEGRIEVLQEPVKTLENKQAKDRRNQTNWRALLSRFPIDLTKFIYKSANLLCISHVVSPGQECIYGP